MISRRDMEILYRRYNRRKYVSPDPLQFLYNYPEIRDREIAGLIAASLAYGRVAQILKSVESVLGVMGESPSDFLDKHTSGTITRAFAGFKHRFTTHDDLAGMLISVKRVIREYGSINECFLSGLHIRDTDVANGLDNFARNLNCAGKYLIPLSGRGSACKRLNLYLRWMVRKDDVDPGGWVGVSKSKLIIPLDTHISMIGRRFGLTGRNTADMKMAREITGAFREITPRDPVKYDFSLTRFGIRSEMSVGDLDRIFIKPGKSEVSRR